MEDTKFIANLPMVDVEVSRKAAEDGSGEILTIRMKATPSLDEAAEVLAPRLLSAFPLMFANPAMLWMQATQAAMTGWLGAMQSMQRLGMADRDR